MLYTSLILIILCTYMYHTCIMYHLYLSFYYTYHSMCFAVVFAYAHVCSSSQLAELVCCSRAKIKISEVHLKISSEPQTSVFEVEILIANSKLNSIQTLKGKPGFFTHNLIKLKGPKRNEHFVSGSSYLI